MSQTPQGSATLSLEEKRRLLVQKLQKQAERGNRFPLSFAQLRLWVVHQMDPAGAAYNMPYALRLRGSLDLRVLARALTGLVRRHESLRTVFPAENGVPVQLVRPAAPVVPLEVDLRHLAPEPRAAEAARLTAEEAARPFDLAEGPLLRVTVLRLAEDDALVLFTLHHVVGDGWSQDVLVRDLSELYTAAAERREPSLPPLPIQYADHAAWQRDYLSGPVLRDQVDYWRGRLAGAPPLLELPTDRPRTTAASARAETCAFLLPADVSESLRALSRRQGGTLFMTLLAAFQVVLSRWSGQDDVVVGTPVAGRSRAEVENLIGFFVNMLPLRTELSGGLTFRALVSRVREGVLEAMAHQDLPFEKLVDELQPDRGPAHPPLFQVSFSLQPPARESLRLGALDAAPAGAGLQQAKYDLVLNMAERGAQVSGALVYRADLFDRGTVERMAAHLQRLLRQVAADPDVPVHALELLDADERARVVTEWNRTETALLLDTCVHGLFEAQAARTPGAPALRFGGDTVTYAALDDEANRVARLLRDRGVGLEDRVALYLEPGPRAVAALLGVLKAGALFVPLDVAAPRDRLAFVLGDCAARLVLTEPGLAAGLDGVEAGVLSLDDAALAAVPAGPVGVAVDPANAAYMIYTSGSTGRPKGVVVPHRAAANMTGASAALAGFGPGARALLFAPLHFDASLADLFPALCSGATLVLAPREALLPGPDLVELLERMEVTHAKMTPTALAALPPAPLPGLRVVSVGGEACTEALVDRWAPGRTFLNVYGPTETTVRVTAVECRPGGGTPS
ncbi:non-ribosomal peptide synthetase, partial [Longimicrobium sp.]|uniref:non-ribosomal peptide synthetase n=1 Tax=Longimicrobium sp. TaxID=2029185 RepID=UPI002E2F6EBC